MAPDPRSPSVDAVDGVAGVDVDEAAAHGRMVAERTDI